MAFACTDARLAAEVQNANLELQTRPKSDFKRESVWEVVALKACVCASVKVKGPGVVSD